jgi:hypothetical protein
MQEYRKQRCADQRNGVDDGMQMDNDLAAHTLAYNLGNFLRTLATPAPIKDWSLTTRG